MPPTPGSASRGVDDARIDSTPERAPALEAAEPLAPDKEQVRKDGEQSGSLSPSAPGDAKASRWAAWLRRWARLRRVMPQRLYWWVEVRFSWRHMDELSRERDDKWNDWSIPPADEHVGLHAVWIVEAYLPSTIGRLIEGLRRLDWWDTHHQEKTIAESVAEGRSGRAGGWQNLPHLRRRSDRGMFLGSIPRELPDGVKIVSGEIHYLTPSLTVLVAGFRFDDTASVQANAILRTRYRTYHRPTGRTSAAVMEPQWQRRDAIRALEKERVDACRAWLGRYVPGYFATAGTSPHPATLLITTAKDVPFEVDRTKGDPLGPSAGWMHTAGLEFALERWETGIPGLRYARRRSDEGVHVLVGRKSDLFADTTRFKGLGLNADVWSLLALAEMNLSRLFAFLTVEELLWDVHRRLGRLRDSLASASQSSTERQLKAVRSQLGTMSSDLTSLTSEVLDWPKRPGWALHEVPDITLIDDFPALRPEKPKDEKPLRTRLLEFYVDHAREVREFEASTRSLLVATADIAGALENIRLQRTVRTLAFLTLLLALLALGATALGVAHDLGLIGATPTPSPLR